MNAGQLLLIFNDIVALLVAGQILRADGTFDKTLLDTIAEDVAFAERVEQVLVKHGLAVPAKVQQVIKLLPLVAALFD